MAGLRLRLRSGPAPNRAKRGRAIPGRVDAPAF